MGSDILVDITVSTASTSTGTWADITGLSASSITVQGTSSVVLLMFQMTIDPAADATAEFRFTVNGSATGSPVITAFTDNAANEESEGCTMMWVVDGLSGSANSFAVQWRTLTGIPVADTTRPRSLQVVEIDSDAEIIVDMSASTTEADPGTWGDLFTSSSVAVAGTGSVLMLISNVPYNMEADEASDFRFAVDTAGEGAVTTASTDNPLEGGGWSGVHCLDGLSTGNHTFHLEWQAISGAGQTDGARLRTFQVVELTANAVLKLDLESSVAGTAPGTYGDVNGLSSSYVVGGTSVIALMFANIQITAAVDRNADFMIGVDGTEEGAELISFTDSTVRAHRILLARAKTGLSAASHTFAARWQNIAAIPTLDTTRARTLFVIELGVVVTYKLEGITKDNAGSALGSCHTFLVKDNLDNTYTYKAYLLSNAVTGAYSFTGLTDNDANYQVISWKDLATHVFDVTDHVLQPVVE